MSKAVGIIPARWNSTRFPGKPLHPIAGKPLLKHVWECCLRAKSLDLVVVATDDMRIASAAFEWGAEVALTSPRHRTGTNRAAEVARKTKQFAYVVNVQGDEPLIDPRLIDKVVGKLQSDQQSGNRDGCASIQGSGGRSFSPPSEGRSRSSRQRSLFLSCADSSSTDRRALVVSPSPGSLRIPARDAASICEMETKSAGAR